MPVRILPVADPSEDVAELLGKSLVRNGRSLNILATLAHHPLLLKRYNALGGLFLRYGEVPPRERELVILRTGWRSGSEYEFGQHTLMGLDAGLSQAEIAALAGNSAESWAPPDRALIAMVDDLWEYDRVSDAAWADLARLWSPVQMIELVMLAGFYRMTSEFLNSVGVQLEPGVPTWPR